MSFAVAGLWVTLVWLAIHVLKYASGRSKPILPVSQYRRPTAEITVKQLSLRLKTEAFNIFHDQLSVSLSSNDSRALKQTLLKLYDLGSLVSLIGMLLGFCLLFATIASLSSEILHAGRGRYHGANAVTKRGLDESFGTTSLAGNMPRISPIIPGLTVPLGHLPLILVALTLSQIVHEAGHAITAALHRIPMKSCGIAVTFVLPSAFVTLPATRLDKLLPRDRLQIVSGGCFHNFVLFCLLLLATWSGAGALSTRILFQDISTLGRLVVGVDYDSPLATHLPVGTLITGIDDFPMSSVSSEDPWDHYLLSPSLPTQGWCTSNSLLNKALVPACTSFNGSHSCFISRENVTTQYELDPISIFTDNLLRCNFSAECSPVSSCVVPHHDEQLVRVSILRSYAGTSMSDMVVWKGPKEEIWEQVRVDHLRPRFHVVPFELLGLASSFFEYMKMANLSLYLVNMLPIVALDGYQSLVVLLQLFYGRVRNNSGIIDPETLDSTTLSSREGRMQRACQAFLSSSALFLVGLCGLLGIVSWARK